MKISGSDTSFTPSVISTPLERTTSTKSLNETEKPLPSDQPQRLSVFISGRAQLMTRVFGSKDPSYEPRILTERSDVNLMMPYGHFLNKDDRQLISEMYEYAQEQHADLKYVDDYAFSLACYRQDGQVMTSHNTGYDWGGHKVTYLFTDKDAAIIKRIQSSEALKTTRVDKGFIRYETDKDLGVISHMDFDFLEKMINKFSAEGDKASPMGAEFSSYKYTKNNYIRHVSKEVYKPKGSGSSADTSDPNAALDKKKTNLRKTKSAHPETLQDALRRIMSKVLRADSRTGVPTLADFLMKFRR